MRRTPSSDSILLPQRPAGGCSSSALPRGAQTNGSGPVARLPPKTLLQLRKGAECKGALGRATAASAGTPLPPLPGNTAQQQQPSAEVTKAWLQQSRAVGEGGPWCEAKAQPPCSHRWPPAVLCQGTNYTNPLKARCPARNGKLDTAVVVGQSRRDAPWPGRVSPVPLQPWRPGCGEGEESICCLHGLLAGRAVTSSHPSPDTSRFPTLISSHAEPMLCHSQSLYLNKPFC